MNIQQLLKYAPATFVLLVMIIGYFVLQIVMGVAIDEPSMKELVNYGVNFLPYTLTDSPWRVLSSGFLHIGIMHLLFNSFALYFFGQVAEQIFKTYRFVILFLLGVIGGNMLSLFMAWQGVLANKYPPVSAGASGGIMGLGMSLLILSFSKLPIAKGLNKRGLMTVMGINLVMGFAIAGIDNAAHIGGALTASILTLAFIQNPKYYLWVALMLIMIFVGVWWYLHTALLTLLASMV